jgi:YVTN family beta-propeller protein
LDVVRTNSVSVFNVADGLNQKVVEIPVGTEPWGVAIKPDNTKVYVTNMASGTVSVIDAATWQVVNTIEVGTEPFGCALTPGGDRLYVANHSSRCVGHHQERPGGQDDRVGARTAWQSLRMAAKSMSPNFLGAKPAMTAHDAGEGADNGREGR